MPTGNEAEFIRWVPSLSGERVSLSVLRLTQEHARWWQTNIQPVINTLPNRADSKWRWRRIAAGTEWAVHQRPVGFAVCLKEPFGGTHMPCALVQLVGRFPALDVQDAKSVFLWYFADAPQDALENLIPKNRIPKMLGTVSLDVAVTHSFSQQLQGRTSLHASPEGGDRLMEWYSRRGMENLPPSAPRPSVFRPNDGRYFYYTPVAALAASRHLDKFRTAGD